MPKNGQPMAVIQRIASVWNHRTATPPTLQQQAYQAWVQKLRTVAESGE